MNDKKGMTTIEQAINNPNFSFLDSFADAQDLAIINKEMATLILKMRALSNELSVAEKKKSNADYAYKKEYNRAYINLGDSAKNETYKKIMAEIECEDLELNVIKFDLLAKEKQRQIYQIRSEIEALRTIASNIKQELQSI